MSSDHLNANVTGNGARTKQVLRASELSYRRLSEAAEDGILILEADTGRINDVNPFLIKLLGLSHSEMVGKTVGELSPFKDIWSNKVMLERLQKDGYIRYDNLPLETRDGRKIAVEFVSNVYQAGDKKVIQCNIREITECKQAKEALRENEERYRGLFEHMVEGFAYCRMIFENGEPKDWIYLAVNPMFEKLTGLKGVAGKRVSEVIPGIAESDSELFKIYARVSLTGKAERFEMFVQALQQWFAISVYSPEKKFFVAVFDIITERKQAEETLQLTRFCMEHAGDGIFWLSPEGRLLYVNKAACQRLGYSESELIGMNIFDLDPDFRPGDWGAHWEKLKRLGTMTFETRHRTKAGQVFPVEVNANCVRTGGQELNFAFTRDITERKQAEEDLRDRETQLRLALDAARMGTWEWDIQTGRVVWSSGHEALWGYAPGTFPGTYEDYESRLHPDDVEGARRAGQKALDEHSNYEHEYRVRWPDGTMRWIVSRGQAFHGPDGKPTRMSGVAMDITERKQAEEALAHERDLLRAMFDILPDYIYLKDEQSRFVACNNRRAADNVTTVTSNNLIGKTDADFFPPEQAARFRADELAVLGGKPLINKEETLVRPDGSQQMILTTKLPFRNSTGKIVGLVGYGRDITEQKRTEEAVRESERRFQTLADTSPVGIFHTNVQGQTTYVNPQWCQITGLSATDALGDGWLRAVHPDDRERLAQGWQAATQAQNISKTDYRFVHPDGTISWVMGQAVPEKDDAGRVVGYVGTITDITERKLAEEQIKRLARFPSENPTAVLRVSAQGVLEYANVAADNFLQTMGAEVGGTVNAKWQAHIGETLAKEHPVNIELQVGNRTFSATLAPIVANGYVNLYASDITERKRAEEALRDSETFLNTVIEKIPHMIFVKEAKELRFVKFNKAGQELLGYSLAELAGKNDYDLFPKEMADHFTENDRKVLRGREVVDIPEEPVQTRDKGERILHTKKIPVFDNAGQLVYLLGISEDITEHKRVEGALNFERELWQTLLDTSPDHIYFKDAQSRFIKSSKTQARQFGVESPEAMVGRTDFDFFTEAHARPAFEDEQKIIRTGEPMIDKEEREVWNDGHVTWAASTKLPLRDAAGKIIGIMGISRDITGRKRIEESQARLATAVEQAAETIMITDTHGTILYANPAFEKTSGYTRAEILGQNSRVLKSGKHDAEFYRRMWEVLGRGEIWSGHFINRRKDGVFYEEEATITPVRDAAGTIVNYVAVKRDVTREVQLEAQFRQAQKMEAVGQLAGGVAHDFNNILGVIIGYGDLITEDLEPDSPLRKYAEEIRHAAVRATGLTQQLLVFSRKQKVQLVVLDLNDTVKNLDKMLRRLIGENIEMMVVPGKEIGRIKADSGYIGQVLMNLAVNARDAMPNGGKITIATNNVTLDENYTQTHTGTIPGDYVMLSVNDTGTGMTKEVKARMFEALFTTKPAGKGTGLGLATCQTIVQQSGGHIDVDSEVGKGATFKIYFPRVDKPLEVAAGPIQTGPLPRGTETLLIVEDEASVRHLAWKVLEALGYHVLRANNGQDALHLVREHKGSPIRLVVTDVIMPRMGGKVMAEWLKATYPDIKVLFTSGYTDDAIVKQGVLEPGVAFLSKPYTPGILASKVRAMLDNETDTTLLRKQGVTINQSPPGST